MKSNVELLTVLSENLEKAREELVQLNEEETLFKFELSEFTQLSLMFVMKEPYEKLWNTAWTFHQRSEAWMNGNDMFDKSELLNIVVIFPLLVL